MPCVNWQGGQRADEDFDPSRRDPQDAKFAGKGARQLGCLGAELEPIRLKNHRNAVPESKGAPIFIERAEYRVGLGSGLPQEGRRLATRRAMRRLKSSRKQGGKQAIRQRRARSGIREAVGWKPSSDGRMVVSATVMLGG